MSEGRRGFVERARDAVMFRVKIHEYYQEVFSTLAGEQVLTHILKHGHVFDTTFVRGDVHETMLREGERRLALSILRHVLRDHKHFQSIAEQQFKQIIQHPTIDDNAS